MNNTVEDFQKIVNELQKVINESRKIVFFGGAGVSTESGIPDFRSVDGLYNQKYDYPPEQILSHSFFVNNPKEFYRFYKDKMLCLDKLPNKAHYKLAELEKAGKLLAVITQNIDGLHQMAGSKKVYELHGSVHRNICGKCGEVYSAEYVKNTCDLPMCEKCNSLLKPDVVLYEEPLDEDVVNGALSAIQSADTLIIAGTSLTVYPAAGFVRYFKGDKIVLINKSETSMDSMADLVYHGSVGELLDRIKI